MHLQLTPTTNTAVKQARIEQTALQPQLMTDTVHAQELTKPTVIRQQNTTSTVLSKAQSKRHHLATQHTINMALRQVVTKQIPTGQLHLMTSTAEKLAHLKPIPQVKQPNTTATVEKLEVLNNISWELISSHA